VRTLPLLVLFPVLACADETPDEGRGDGGASGIGSVTAPSGGSDESSAGASMSGDSDAESSGASGDDPSADASSGGSGPKFDIGDNEDTSPGCGGGDTDATPTFSYIWIANTSEGTVSKINTQTGLEEGRYRTAETSADSPSRTSVNQFGDVLVGNRLGGGAATKIAAVEARCVERNGVPGIQTSTGPQDVLPYLEDECVVWSVPMPIIDHGPRGIAWEGGELDPATCMNTVPNPRVWVSFGGNPEDVYRLDGDTGAVLDHVSFPQQGGRIYGGAVDGEGNLWYVNRGADHLARIDAVTLQRMVWEIPNVPYGMGVDANGDPWVVSYDDGPADRVYRFDVATQSFIDAGGGLGRYRGMNLDRQGRVWVAGNSPCRLAVFDATTDTVIDDDIALAGCTTPVGVSIDFEGFVWVVDQNGTAYKVNPMDYSIALTVSGLSGPYTYSDMTGAGLNLVVNPPG
jgi:hypothetical protein